MPGRVLLTDPLPRIARAEAALALAMLPTGGTLVVLSAIAVPLMVLAAGIAAARGSPPIAGWCLVAALVALWNLVRAIAVISAFDWRPLPGIALRTALVAAAWPGWW